MRAAFCRILHGARENAKKRKKEKTTKKEGKKERNKIGSSMSRRRREREKKKQKRGPSIIFHRVGKRVAEARRKRIRVRSCWRALQRRSPVPSRNERRDRLLLFYRRQRYRIRLKIPNTPDNNEIWQIVRDSR